MLGQALVLTLLLLLRGHQGQGKEAQPGMGWGMARTWGLGPRGDQNPEPLDYAVYKVAWNCDTEQLLRALDRLGETEQAASGLGGL